MGQNLNFCRFFPLMAPLRHLLSSPGTSADVVNERGDSLLMCAAKKGSLDSVRVILAAGVDLDKRGSLNQTALMWARQEAKRIDGFEDPGLTFH